MGVPHPKPAYINNKAVYYTTSLFNYFKDCILERNDFSQRELDRFSKYEMNTALEMMNIKQGGKGYYMAGSISQFLVNPDRRNVLLDKIKFVINKFYPELTYPSSTPASSSSAPSTPAQGSLFPEDELNQLVVPRKRDPEL